jgi:hypothetical protein
MLEMVNDRRNGDTKEERYDLFSGLLDASQEEPESGPAINDQELMGKSSFVSHFGDVLTQCILTGNMFIIILAGHEVGSSPSRGLCPKTLYHRQQPMHCASHSLF